MGAARESKTDEQRAFQIAWAVVSTRAVQALDSSFFLFLGPLGGTRWTMLMAVTGDGRRVSFLQRTAHHFQQRRAAGQVMKVWACVSR